MQHYYKTTDKQKIFVLRCFFIWQIIPVVPCLFGWGESKRGTPISKRMGVKIEMNFQDLF